MINSSYRNKSCRFASTMDTGRKKFCRFHGFRVQGSGFRVQGSGLWWRLRREYIWGDARRSFEMLLCSYRQPSPRGEGAPKGRIGHRRYARERANAVADHLAYSQNDAARDSPVTSHQSPVTSHLRILIPSHSSLATSPQSLATNHQKRNRFRDSLFYFLSPP